MPQARSELPRYLVERSRRARLSRAGVPALLAHPDWSAEGAGVASPRPTLIWMHGRTATKELDPGRYMRCLRAGIATCAIDLPHHGERYDAEGHDPRATLDTIAQVVGEIDHVVDALADPIYAGAFDLDRLALGGMSAGGMATLRRLCDPHPFVAAAVEGTTGWLEGLYAPRDVNDPSTPSWVRERWPRTPDPVKIARVDASRHLEGTGAKGGFRPIPLLVLHAETDRVVPIGGMTRFVEMLREHYRSRGAEAGMIEVKTWRDTGAPDEHAGFGVYGNDAKNAQVEFLSRVFFGE